MRGAAEDHARNRDRHRGVFPDGRDVVREAVAVEVAEGNNGGLVGAARRSDRERVGRGRNMDRLPHLWGEPQRVPSSRIGPRRRLSVREVQIPDRSAVGTEKLQQGLPSRLGWLQRQAGIRRLSRHDQKVERSKCVYRHGTHGVIQIGHEIGHGGVGRRIRRGKQHRDGREVVPPRSSPSPLKLNDASVVRRPLAGAGAVAVNRKRCGLKTCSR